MKIPIRVGFALWASILLLTGCIGNDYIDDFVEPSIRITNGLDTLGLGDSYQLEAIFLNNIGQEAAADFEWKSDAPEIVSVDPAGLLFGEREGSARVTVSTLLGDTLLVETTQEIIVGENTTVSATERSGTIQTTSSYQLEGDFVLRQNGANLVLDIAENYQASSSLPGLYIYLTNNPSTTNGAFEIGPVSVFSGAHSYELPGEIGLNDYDYVLYFCKPFNVKVGDGAIEN